MIPRPRITFLITDLHRGGSPLLLAALAPALAARGKFNIDVVSIAPRGEVAEILEHRGIVVTSLNARGNRDTHVIKRFARHVQQHQPQIVCSILIHANLLAALAKSLLQTPLKWVHSIHTLQRKPRWHWYLQGMLCASADALVAPSRAIIHELQKYGAVPRPTVIPNGIDVPRFYNAQPIPLQKRPWPRDAFVIGYIGRFDPVKRLDLLLRSAAKLISSTGENESKKLHIALVGYGKQAAALRRLTSELAIVPHIHMLPPTDRPEQWYKTFDAFCSPSAAEGFGLTLAEATAAGRRVIACNTAAVRETLAAARAPIWLSQEPTTTELAQALKLVMQPHQSEPFTLKTLEQRYSEETMVIAYERFFEQLLGVINVA